MFFSTDTGTAKANVEKYKKCIHVYVYMTLKVYKPGKFRQENSEDR